MHALARVSVFMSFRQKRIIMDAFITSKFCHNRNAQKQINRIHERALRIVYNDNNSSFEYLLTKSGYVSIHHTNLQVAIEGLK